MPEKGDLRTAVKSIKKQVENLKTDMGAIKDEIQDTTTAILPGRLGMIRTTLIERRRSVKERMGKPST